MRPIILTTLFALAVVTAAVLFAGCDGAPLEARFRWTTIESTDTRARHGTPASGSPGARPDFELSPAAAALELVVGDASTAIPRAGRFELQPWTRAAGTFEWSRLGPALQLEAGQVAELGDVAGADGLWLEIVWLEREGSLEVGLAP